MPTEKPEITVLVKQGKHVGAVLDALLRAGFELSGKTYSHAGRELHVIPPLELFKNA